jgi:hypothetical protein
MDISLTFPDLSPSFAEPSTITGKDLCLPRRVRRLTFGITTGKFVRKLHRSSDNFSIPRPGQKLRMRWQGGARERVTSSFKMNLKVLWFDFV